jgi:hypothetical protein
MKQAALWVVISAIAISAWAHISVENEPVHHALYPQHANKSVVAAVIAELRGQLATGDSTFVRTLVVQVDGLVLDRHWPDRRTAELGTYHLRWPLDLVAPRPGARLFLIVRSDFPEKGELYVSSILPRRGTNLPRVATEAEAQGIIAADLLTQVHSEESAKRLVALLNELAPILTSGDAEAVAPLLRHPDAAVRRSALAATLYATEDDAIAQAVARDLGSFFEKGAGRSCLADPEASCAGTRELFRAYFFLDPLARRWGSRWSEEEAIKDTRLFNSVAAHAALSPAAMRVLERIP